jgi:hypothetical protein
MMREQRKLEEWQREELKRTSFAILMSRPMSSGQRGSDGA